MSAYVLKSVSSSSSKHENIQKLSKEYKQWGAQEYKIDFSPAQTCQVLENRKKIKKTLGYLNRLQLMRTN